MTISVQNFVTLVENQVAAIQGFCASLVDFTIGSILRALIESNAGQGLFLQGQALQVAALTRLATCQGADVDSFLADYGFDRLGASRSTGQVTLGRFTTTMQALVQAGALVQSFDGSQQFIILADTTNAAWNATLNAYVVAAGTASVTVLAQSVNKGAATNVLAGTITQLVTAIPGISTVTNASPFEGGADPETDAAVKIRFQLYLSTLSRATRAAILYAVNQVQAGLSQSLVENLTYSGATTSGYFYDVVDDGSGNPPSGLLSSVASAIDNNRALGIAFSVFPPVTITANASMTLGIASGYVRSTCVAAVDAAVTAYIQSLGLGAPLSYLRLAQIAFDASPGVTDVTSLLLNGGTADLTATAQQRIVPGTIAAA